MPCSTSMGCGFPFRARWRGVVSVPRMPLLPLAEPMGLRTYDSLFFFFSFWPAFPVTESLAVLRTSSAPGCSRPMVTFFSRFFRFLVGADFSRLSVGRRNFRHSLPPGSLPNGRLTVGAFAPNCQLLSPSSPSTGRSAIFTSRPKEFPPG